jgi:hypothetical protein
VRRRPPWWLLAVVVAVIAVAVAGNFATGYRGRSEPASTTEPQPSLASLAARSDTIVEGRVVAVRRLGQPRDPTVVATIAVDERLKPPSGAATIQVTDRGFVEDWSEGDRVLLFVRSGRVVRRYVEGKGRPLPFTVDEVRRAVGSS